MAEIDQNFKDEDQLTIPEVLPLLPVRDIVVFPYMIVPLFVGRDRSISAVDAALAKDRLIFMTTQKDITKEDPEAEDLYTFGTVGMIMRMLKLPDGRVKILVQGIARAKINTFIQTKPSFSVNVTKVEFTQTEDVSIETEALMRNVRDLLEKLSSLGKMVFPEMMMVLENVSDPGRLADLVAANLGLEAEEAQGVLETLNPLERLEKVNELLTKELQLSQMQAKIQTQAKEEMDKSQREYYLREQLKAIKTELGDIEEASDEFEELLNNIKKANMPENAEKETIKQLDKLEMMHPDAAEASVIRTYIEWLIEIPWGKQTKDTIDLSKAKDILDNDHYGLDKIKERILEYLAVRKLKKTTKGPILCFIGPPGVGKTSLGKSIARAMGREFVRMSLGGIKDEAEIRGHRRTYVGAMPGRIIQGMKQAGSSNPVFMLDEIDKIGMDFRGDPSSALLEVLDPEQNNSFSDHYLNVPYDLSKVMFIMTANVSDSIPSPLKDRMEVITLPGYTEEEKVVITRKYLLPRQVEENGLNDKLIAMPDETLRKTIAEYTREAGLRNLEREVAKICRKVAKNVATGEKKLTTVKPEKLSDYLGTPVYLAETEKEADSIGLATGLAWTPVGGEILHIEASIMNGKGQLILTGHLGEVMKESAQAAFSYIRTKTKELGLKEDFYKTIDLHIHVPAGAIPKDGPSAGITIATALISALTKTKIDKNLAMTGELTLRGRILPIGGLKEKCLAAMRSNITKVLIPDRNKKDLDDIPVEVKKKLKIVLVSHMDEVIENVFNNKTTPPKVKTKPKTKIKAKPKTKIKAKTKTKAKPKKSKTNKNHARA